MIDRPRQGTIDHAGFEVRLRNSQGRPYAAYAQDPERAATRLRANAHRLLTDASPPTRAALLF
jgi:hypothetical protein